MSMYIQFFNSDRLVNNEFLLFSKDVEALVTKFDPTELKVETVFSEFKSSLIIYDDSIVKVKGSRYTILLQNAGNLRKKRFSGIINRILMNLDDLDSVNSESARILEPIARSFQKGQNKRFTDLSGYTINLIQELRSDANKPHIEKLGLTKRVDDLDTLNNLCISLSNDRTDEQATRLAAGKTVDTRPLLKSAYEDLRELLNAQALVNKTKIYADLFRELNARIDFYRVVISNHLGKGKGGKTGGGNSTPPSGGEEERPGEL
ncbi:DUF6261 family protein [Parabacteroides sp. ASD2025]|jgi:hypothetical protein|uniref:DUF6261 family protein n=1 Tax=Parabacteroides sp. ASD2025 TaxID=3415987 RepID=UPI0025DB5E74|nr:DUF6261 family protein [uncultured Parabacteroides sp.]